MSSPAQDLWVRPLFYDALSGEFWPLSDPEHRAHTLGRLAYASFENGIRSYDTSAGFGSIRGSQFRYQPSWAPVIEATVSCRMKGERPELAGISISDRADRLLVVQDTTDQQTACELIIPEETKMQIPLNLAGLNDAKKFITQAAAMFFEHVE